MAQRRRGGGGKATGFKGAIYSGIALTIGIAVLLGIGKANNINDIDGIFRYMDSVRESAYDCGIEDAKWDCPDKDGADFGGEEGTTKPAPIAPGEFSPPSSAAVTEQEKTSSVTAVANMKIAEDDKTIPYDRKDWKHWTGKPCNSRIQILERDGKKVAVENCKVVSGNWEDPYSDLTFTNSSDLDIDHIIPLAFANRHGGAEWDAAKKEQFANDPQNLLASSAKENRKKSDDGPGDYMPPRKEFHCSYSNSWVQLANKYDLTVTQKDQRALENGLRKC